MSFRIEYKYILYPNYIFHFFEKYGEIKKIFPDRNISSIYFDNKKLDCHNFSIEGLVPRQKIRIRNYNNVDKYFLENYGVEYSKLFEEETFKQVKREITLRKLGI